jgi:multidrug efflux pump subunit AcrA (membrane-fusion protein)
MPSLPPFSREILKKPWFKWVAGGIIILAVAGVYASSRTEETVDLIVQPTMGPFRVTVTAAGDLRAKNAVMIMGPTAARNLRLPEIEIQHIVPEGTVVQKGDYVAELDRSQLQTRLQDMQLEMEQTLSTYEQTKLDTLMTLSQARDQHVDLQYAMEEARIRMEQSVYEAASVRRQAEIDYEKAQRAYQQAIDQYQTQVAQAQARMRAVDADLLKAQREYDALAGLADGFTVLAPENGMVIYRRQRNGTRIMEGSAVSSWDPVIAELPDLSIMESVTYINEVDIQKIRVGQHVEVGLDADADTKVTGTVTRVANVGEQRPDSDAKVFEVIVQINETDSTLRPAMTTSNTIIVAEVPEALQIPLETIHTDDSLNFVYKRSGGGVTRQEVLLGLLNENNAVVLAGVEVGDELYLSTPSNTTGASLIRLSPEVIEERMGEPEVVATNPGNTPAALQDEPEGGNDDEEDDQAENGDAVQRPRGQRPGGGNQQGFQGGEGGPGGQDGSGGPPAGGGQAPPNGQ